MRSSFVLISALTGVFALIIAPGFVIGTAFLAAAVWVGWRMLTHRSGPLRRQGWSR